jgi:hypothetical protein
VGLAEGKIMDMEYQETYHGQQIVVTTLKAGTDAWKAKAELLDAGHRIPVGEMGDGYPSEDEAKRAAIAAAVGAIDRARITRGKP